MFGVSGVPPLLLLPFLPVAGVPVCRLSSRAALQEISVEIEFVDREAKAHPRFPAKLDNHAAGNFTGVQLHRDPRYLGLLWACPQFAFIGKIAEPVLRENGLVDIEPACETA